MATKTVTTELELAWANGKKTTLKLPTPINSTLTDPDTGDSLVTAAWFDSAAAFLESDEGASLQSIAVSIVTVSTEAVVTINGGSE